MNNIIDEQRNTEKEKFKLEFITPYSTFRDGEPAVAPYVIDGLLTEGGFSILAAKPKHGKSSISRYEAVCVAKGVPFLGRETRKGGVILISLEDPRHHVDNCLRALGYDPITDAPIRIIERLPPKACESVELLGEALSEMPEVRLVIVDTMAKLLRVKDLNEYMPVLSGVEQLRNLARRFPRLHIQGLAHCKKTQTDDPFDSLLGSTALRGETDTNVAIYQQNGRKVIATETRIGKSIPPTILEAEVVESEGADIVKGFSLSCRFDEWKEDTTEKRDKKQTILYEHRIIDYLQNRDGLAAPQELVLEKVEGKRKNLLDAITRLADKDVVRITGKPHSPTNSLTLTLIPEALSMYYFGDGDFQKAGETFTSPRLSAMGFADDDIADDSKNAEGYVK